VKTTKVTPAYYTTLLDLYTAMLRNSHWNLYLKRLGS